MTWAKRDLHAIVRDEGLEAIAIILDVTARCLVDLRRGEHPLTVDDLYRLGQKFNDFDLIGTVQRVGKKRRATGKKSHGRSSRKVRGQKYPEGPKRLLSHPGMVR